MASCGLQELQNEGYGEPPHPHLNPLPEGEEAKVPSGFA
jgi:hypothetical protein